MSARRTSARGWTERPILRPIAAANSGLLRRGALVTRADVFERIERIDTVLLDKTGTLTQVQSVRCIPVPGLDLDATNNDSSGTAIPTITLCLATCQRWRSE